MMFYLVLVLLQNPTISWKGILMTLILLLKVTQAVGIFSIFHHMLLSLHLL